MKDEHFDVARTRKCAECGVDEEMRKLALPPSFHPYIYVENNWGFKDYVCMQELCCTL